MSFIGQYYELHLLRADRPVFILQRIINSFNELGVFVRHRYTLSVFKRFGVGDILHLTMVALNNVPNCIQTCSEKLLPHVDFVNTEFVKLSMQCIFEFRRIIRRNHHMNVERKRH